MRCVFLEPPASGRIPERVFGCSYELYHLPDLANLYLMSTLIESGCEVDYVDGVAEGFTREQFLARVEASSADVLILHSVLLSAAADLEVGPELLRRCPNANLIYHGPDPTRRPADYAFDERVLVFRGEPERNVPAFLERGDRIGLSWIEDGRLNETPPEPPLELDSLPLPARTHPAVASSARECYNPKFRGTPHTAMLASRGCAFHCRFCVPNAISFARELEHQRFSGKKPKPSVASAATVVSEFRAVQEQGFGSVLVMDDQFLWAKGRTLEICEGIRDLGIEWGCLSRADFLADAEVVAALANAGCRSIDIGVESLDQGILDDIRKDLDVNCVHTATGLLREHGISAKLNIMFGCCPAETEETVRRTIKAVRQLRADNVMFSIATPFEGTEFHCLCEREGYLVDSPEHADPLRKSIVSYPHLSAKELERLQRAAYRSQYLRPGFVCRRLLSGRGIRGLMNDIRIGIKLLWG